MGNLRVFCSVPVKNDQISDGFGCRRLMLHVATDVRSTYHILSLEYRHSSLWFHVFMHVYVYIYMYRPYLIVQVLFTFMISLSQSYFYQSIIQYKYIYIYLYILIYVDMFTTAGNEDVTSSTSSHRTHRAPAKLSLVERQVLGFWDGKMQWVEG
jgi:hypothetical protein